MPHNGDEDYEDDGSAEQDDKPRSGSPAQESASQDAGKPKKPAPKAQAKTKAKDSRVPVPVPPPPPLDLSDRGCIKVEATVDTSNHSLLSAVRTAVPANTRGGPTKMSMWLPDGATCGDMLVALGLEGWIVRGGETSIIGLGVRLRDGDTFTVTPKPKVVYDPVLVALGDLQGTVTVLAGSVQEVYAQSGGALKGLQSLKEAVVAMDGGAERRSEQAKKQHGALQEELKKGFAKVEGRMDEHARAARSLVTDTTAATVVSADPPVVSAGPPPLGAGTGPAGVGKGKGRGTIKTPTATPTSISTMARTASTRVPVQTSPQGLAAPTSQGHPDAQVQATSAADATQLPASSRGYEGRHVGQRPMGRFTYSATRDPPTPGRGGHPYDDESVSSGPSPYGATAAPSNESDEEYGPQADAHGLLRTEERTQQRDPRGPKRARLAPAAQLPPTAQLTQAQLLAEFQRYIQSRS